MPKVRGKREWDEKNLDKSVLCHRYYSAVSVNGDEYRAMILVKEQRPIDANHLVTPYTIEVKAMELKKMKPSEVPVGQDIPAANWGNASNGFVMGANLLKDVEKSHMGCNIIVSYVSRFVGSLFYHLQN